MVHLFFSCIFYVGCVLFVHRYFTIIVVTRYCKSISFLSFVCSCLVCILSFFYLCSHFFLCVNVSVLCLCVAAFLCKMNYIFFACISVCSIHYCLIF